VKLWKASGVWKVPSQFGGGSYVVNINDDCIHCSFPDHASRGVKCKHIYAVEYTINHEVSEEITVLEKRTYTQNCPAYIAAQTNEKRMLLTSLRDLCMGIEEPLQIFALPQAEQFRDDVQHDQGEVR